MKIKEAKSKKKNLGLDANSLVETPAIEILFIAFNKEEPDEEKAISIVCADNEKRRVLGPMMVPNKPIYRSAKSMKDEEDGYIYWTKSTIEADRLKMFIERKNVNIKLDHDSKTDDAVLIESWIIEDLEKDKSALYFKPEIGLKVGTLMAMYQILSDELWQDIKAGKYKGFSVEGWWELEEKKTLTKEEKAKVNLEEELEEREIIPDNLIPVFLTHLKKVGQTREELAAEGWELVEDDKLKMAIESSPNESSRLDRKNYLVRYAYKLKAEYQGEPMIIPTSRNFCVDVVNANLWYREEDINQMSFRGENSEDFGIYSIKKYAGSFGCRHYWEKNYFSKSMKFEIDPEGNIEIEEQDVDEVSETIAKEIELHLGG